MKRSLIISLLFLFFRDNSIAQVKSIDSLLVGIKSAKQDTNKVNLLNKIAKEFAKEGDFKNSDNYFLQAKDLAEKLGAKKAVAYAFRSIGINSFDQSDYSRALENHLSALKNYETIHDSLGISACYNNIGLVYMMGQANYPKALEYYLRALKIKEQIKDKAGIYKSFMNIGEVYYFQENYALALRYYFKALQCAKQLGNSVSEARCYMNIGVAYENQKFYDKALEYQTRSLQLCEKLNDKTSIGKCYGNIANLYYDKGEFQKALDCELKAQAIKEEGYEKASISDGLNNIGETYVALKDYTKANEYYLRALKMKEEINDKYGLRGCYAGLSNIYAKTQHYKEAYEYQIKFRKLNDSLFNIENSKQLGDLKTNFEVEKKSTELKIKSDADKEKLKAINAEEKKVQQIITAAVVGVLLIVLVFSFFLFKRFRLTNKQKQIIEIKNNETESQKHLIEEKQKEIIDSITYAKRLQSAILPSIESIKKILPDSFVFYQPKDIVAGDFYWMHISPSRLEKDGKGLVFIAAADSTGHGVPGAMVSIVCSNALDKAVKEFGLTDTGKILDKTTDLVLETFDHSGEEIKDGMDISLICFDQLNKKVFWSGANNQLWYVNNDTIVEVKPNKQPIGKSDHRIPFTTNEIEYKEGTMFYLMTDGLADQFGGPKGKKFMYKRLEQKLLQISKENTGLQKEILIKVYKDWLGDLDQLDDITIIGIRI